MEKRVIYLVVGVIIILVAIALLSVNEAPKQTPNGGINGTVLLGPTCPVIRNPPDANCADKPYSATITVKTADGSSEVTEFASGDEGKFRVALAPGTYLLDPQSPSGQILPRGSPQTVTVEEGQFTPVTISYDTGIR